MIPFNPQDHLLYSSEGSNPLLSFPDGASLHLMDIMSKRMPEQLKGESG